MKPDNSILFDPARNRGKWAEALDEDRCDWERDWQPYDDEPLRTSGAIAMATEARDWDYLNGIRLLAVVRGDCRPNLGAVYDTRAPMPYDLILDELHTLDALASIC